LREKFVQRKRGKTGFFLNGSVVDEIESEERKLREHNLKKGEKKMSENTYFECYTVEKTSLCKKL